MKLFFMFIVLISCSACSSQDQLEYTIIIRNHQFQPATLTVPRDTPFRLLIENQDDTPEEFESHDFNREKIIPGNSTAVIHVAALDPGTYRFFGEFNEDTAQGELVVN